MMAMVKDMSDPCALYKAHVNARVIQINAGMSRRVTVPGMARRLVAAGPQAVRLAALAHRAAARWFAGARSSLSEPAAQRR
jgi:hypothetical protein